MSSTRKNSSVVDTELDGMQVDLHAQMFAGNGLCCHGETHCRQNL